MARVSRALGRRTAKKKLFREAKGNFGGRKNLLRTVKETIKRSMAFATRDRRVRKREFRALWNQRINAASRIHGLSYSKFMGGLKKADVAIDRKILADLAVRDLATFGKIVELAKNQL